MIKKDMEVMKRSYQLENRNFLLRNTCKASRDPDKQVFDNYDFENDFVDSRMVYRYRVLGEKVMQQYGP